MFDLPQLSAAINMNYLKELIKKDCRYFKINRTLTRPLPEKNWKCFDSKETLKALEKALKKYGKKPSGFSTF